jgi:hypothetical protein
VPPRSTIGDPSSIAPSASDGTYEFGLAAFDNAQVRHAIHFGALQLKFAK